MNIVVLDGYTLNPGDLSWERLAQMGSMTVYDRTSPEQIVERAIDAEIILTNKTPLTATTLAKLPNLCYIGVLATGYNIVDIHAARKRDIPVSNVPTYGTQSVAQFVFAMIFELCHSIGRHDAAVKAGEWTGSIDFCFTKAPLIELSGKTIGLVGLGKIGSQTARIASAMDMRVLAVGSGRSHPKPVAGVEWTNMETLLKESDIVSLHCPLTPDTEQLINRQRLSWMKPSAFLINTSRGGLIHEQDLADALNAQAIAGAAVDVLSVEPPSTSNPLLSARNCIITPHIAWATQEARARLMETTADNVSAFLEGRPINVVN
ncbi:D-2-hydroxyacid dehydrogenase [Paenibacillus sp. RC67]|uniref:D-2-hydroxyacid dehydrogenase n=1 Tax=Paenibacillus sp. RC67 TaxID=3039392 RepID=UPI0024AD6A70|nr:D-2-hydroxyacid dehydrogenase [Paenibacillus sp. RC67]